MIHANAAREKTDKVYTIGFKELEAKHDAKMKIIDNCVGIAVDKGEYQTEVFFAFLGEDTRTSIREIKKILKSYGYKASVRMVEAKSGQYVYMFTLSWDNNEKVSIRDLF